MNFINDNVCPALDEISEMIGNKTFDHFCFRIKETYNVTERMEFSKCSWIPGWNIKFKKNGKTLCTLYPKERYFTVMVVVGKKEKEAAEAFLKNCSPVLKSIYAETEEGNGQRWLMIDLEDEGTLFEEVLALIAIRVQCR